MEEETGSRMKNRWKAEPLLVLGLCSLVSRPGLVLVPVLLSTGMGGQVLACIPFELVSEE